MAAINAGNCPLRQGHLPAFATARNSATMRAMSRDLISRIDARLEALGKKPEAASRDAGLGRDFIRTLKRRPNSSPLSDNLAKLASALECNVDYLLGQVDEPGRPDPLPIPHQVTLPIRYEVAAGPWLAVDDLPDEPLGWGEANAIPQYPYPQWLERVRGDSFNRHIPDGALIHVVDAIAMGYAPRHGDVVVVSRTRGQGALVERTVKQIEVLQNGDVELWPRSHNPKWSKPLVLDHGAEMSDDTVVEISAKVLRSYVSF